MLLGVIEMMSLACLVIAASNWSRFNGPYRIAFTGGVVLAVAGLATLISGRPRAAALCLIAGTILLPTGLAFVVSGVTVIMAAAWLVVFGRATSGSSK